MKQYLKIILFSCIVGTSMAIAFFLNIKEKAEAKTTTIAYTFGVFKNIDNANNFSNQYSVSKIVKDNDLYRVFIGATVKNKEYLESLFKNNGYNYYIKEIIISDSKYKSLEKYDIVLEQSESPELILEKMLEILPDEL